VDGVSLEAEKSEKRLRSKTVPCNEEKDAMHLFSMFEVDQLRAKSHKLRQSQEIFVADQLSEPDAVQSSETISNEASFQIPDLIPLLELAERISKFAIGAYGTSMMKILKYFLRINI
jgi:hypothetical protein